MSHRKKMHVFVVSTRHRGGKTHGQGSWGSPTSADLDSVLRPAQQPRVCELESSNRHSNKSWHRSKWIIFSRSEYCNYVKTEQNGKTRHCEQLLPLFYSDGPLCFFFRQIMQLLGIDGDGCFRCDTGTLYSSLSTARFSTRVSEPWRKSSCACTFAKRLDLNDRTYVNWYHFGRRSSLVCVFIQPWFLQAKWYRGRTMFWSYGVVCD